MINRIAEYIFFKLNWGAILCLFISMTGVHAQADRQCHQLFLSQLKKQPEQIQVHRQIATTSTLFESKTKYRLYVESTFDLSELVRNPEKRQQIQEKKVWLFVHGLGDSMANLKDLAMYFPKDKNEIIFVDLLGHGQTQDLNLSADKSDLSIEKQIEIVSEMAQTLIQQTGIRSLQILGHSYGGGVSIGVHQKLQNEMGLVVDNLILLAPYVQRVDNYLRDPQSWLALFGGAQLSQSVKSFERVLSQWNLNPFPFYNSVIGAISDAAVMSQLKGRLLNLYISEGMTFAQARVKTNIILQLIQQSQHLNWLEADLHFGRTRVTLVGSTQDAIVPQAQINELAIHLQNERTRLRLKWIDASHFFPTKNPEQTAQLLPIK